MSEIQLQIALLERQVEALRSVIAELTTFDDLNCYLQWQRAQAIAELLNYVKRG